MREINNLWNSRAKDYWNNAIRYLRLIGNSGFLFTLYLLIIIGGYYYSLFLQWLPEWFPVAIMLAIVVSFYLTRSPVRTFVKEGDLVFLLPLEQKLGGYFIKSIAYSFLFQSFFLLLGFIVIGPLYFERISGDRRLFWFTIGLLLLVKLWNLFSSWYEQRFSTDIERNTHVMLRFIVNFSFTYLLFMQAAFIFLVIIGALYICLILFYYLHIPKRYSIKWERLLKVEEKMVAMFYRIANLFTDVPRFKSKVKKRPIVLKLINFLPYNKKAPFQFLYLKSFVRSNDYFGVYIRLILIAAIMLTVIPDGIIRLLVFILFLYMSGLQLSTLWHHYDTKVWVELYPLSKEKRMDSFSYIVSMLLIVKSIILCFFLFIIGSGLTSIIFVFIGIGFSYIYGYKIVHRRKKVA